MTTTTNPKIEVLKKQADELAASEILTETNSGTYSATEAHAAIGVGDSAYADYCIYIRVGDGSKRRVGCDPAEAPGYARRFRQELAAAQKELRNLRKQIAGR